MVDRNLNHHVVVTAIVVRDGKFLIAKRADWEKAFPGRWTVPGGKVEVLDYALREKDTPHHWYNVLEDAVRREVVEEAGLQIGHLGYVTSMVYLKKGNVPCLIVSLYADAKEGEVRLCNALTDYAWVDLADVKNYDLIEGIYEELEIVDKILRGDGVVAWEKRSSEI
jgi:8-oxo-dGTP pyrophosphatase MutT (NUDIX family)